MIGNSKNIIANEKTPTVRMLLEPNRRCKGTKRRICTTPLTSPIAPRMIPMEDGDKRSEPARNIGRIAWKDMSSRASRP